MTSTAPAEPTSASNFAGPLGLLRLPRKIVLGSGQRHSIGPIVAEVGRSALICTDARLAASEELVAIVDALTASGVRSVVYGDTAPELPVPGIINCVDSVSGTTIDVVIGFGGGSCLDMAKAVAVLLAHGGKPQDYYGEGVVPGPIVPVVAVPTTSGTGSEATPVAVLSDPERALKIGISSPYLIPEVALIDPELTHSCPRSLTAAAGIDAVVHLVESFTAIRRPVTSTLTTERVFVGKSQLTDAIAREGLSLMGRSLVASYDNGSDAAARHDVMVAAFYGGLTLGTAGTAAAHALQYPLGALTHTPHGFGTGCLLPYVMRYNFPERIREFGEIAQALKVPGLSADPVARARAGVEAVDKLVAGVHIPPTLADLGATRDQIPTIAEQGLKSKRLVDNNPRLLDYEASLAITTAAYEGDLDFPDVSALDPNLEN
jgi:alcohol dehydrogenase